MSDTAQRGLQRDRFARRSTPTPESLDDFLGTPPERMADRAAEMGLPSIMVAPNNVHPDPQQPRQLEHPDVLRQDAVRGDRAAQELLTELQELGASMQAHGQLQPIIVSRAADDAAPYHILLGQRRWSAALLVALPTLWAIVVEPPTPLDRLLRQYDENEQRASLSDMERTWTLQRVKQAYDESDQPRTWIDIARLFQLSTQRRQDLLRLLRFSATGQARIARHRWSEWTLRSLHAAIQADDLTQDVADAVLRELARHAEPVTAETVRTAVIYHTQDVAGDVDDGVTAVPGASLGAQETAPGTAGGTAAVDDDADTPTQAVPENPRTSAATPEDTPPSRRDRATALAQAQTQLRVVRRVAGDLMRLGQQIATSDADVADNLHAALDDVQAQLDVVRAALAGDTAV